MIAGNGDFPFLAWRARAAAASDGRDRDREEASPRDRAVGARVHGEPSRRLRIEPTIELCKMEA